MTQRDVWRNGDGTWSHRLDAQRQWPNRTACATDFRFAREHEKADAYWSTPAAILGANQMPEWERLEAERLRRGTRYVVNQRRFRTRDEALAFASGVFAKTGVVAAVEEDSTPRSSIFDSHRCWKCDDGARPCVRGTPNRCEYPRALND